MEEYLKSCHFDKYFKKLIKKLNGKTVIVYGTGSMFQYILKNYDLSKLNIISICDKKYKEEGEDLGFKAIPKSKLETQEPDYLVLGVQNYTTLMYQFAENIFKNKKTQIIPIVKRPVLQLLKEIWCK